jgi:hypothetical protein
MQQLATTPKIDMFNLERRDPMSPIFEPATPFDQGAWRSYVPTLGMVLWEMGGQDQRESYFAYTFELENGRTGGFVRVPDYNYNAHRIDFFRELVRRFEETTDVLVFDQVRNNGGSMLQMYSLLSILTDTPIAVPRHVVIITGDVVEDAEDVLDNADFEAPERVRYSQLILDERAAGRGAIPRRLSTPLHLMGIEWIEPDDVHYTKPIIVLNSSLTMSAGEFLAAMVKDSHRGVIFGSVTAGAGGAVREITVPSDIFSSMKMPWTVGRRINGEFINNFGVQPHIAYELTEEDIQSVDPFRTGEAVRPGFQEYRRNLLATIHEVIDSGQSPDGHAESERSELDTKRWEAALTDHQVWRETKTESGTRLVIKDTLLPGMDFRGNNLSFVSLRNCDLSQSDFNNVELSFATLHRSTLHGANLSGADMTQAFLCDADFTGANFRDTTLAKAEFDNAILKDTDLTGADLTDATLSGADLTSAKGLTREQLKTCHWSKGNPVMLPAELQYQNS